MGLMDPIGQAIGYITNVIAYLMQTITTYATQLLSGLITWVADMLTTIGNWLLTLFNNMATFFQQLMQGMVTWLAEFLQQLRDFFVPIVQAIVNLARDLLTAFRGFAQTIIQDVANFVAALVNTVTHWIGNVMAALITSIQNAVTAISNFLTAALNGVVEWLADTLQAIITFLTDVGALITAGLETLITGANAIILTIESRLADLGAAFTDAFTVLRDGLRSVSDETLVPIRDAVLGYLDKIEDLFDLPQYQQAFASVEAAVSPGTLNLRGAEGFKRLWDNLAPQGRIGRITWYLFFGYSLMTGAMGGIVSANAQSLLQEYSLHYPWALLSPADVISAYRRDNASQAKVLDTIRASGFTAEDAVMMIKNSETVPAVGELLAMKLRGTIQDAELTAALNVYGLKEPWVAALKELAQVIPPISDLIMMAVRDVFDPQVAQTFGLFNEYPQLLTPEAAKHGLSAEWAQRYWGAHWSLPSASQGFEMLHRGVIDQEQLNLLLRALDVMPFWRERMTQIAYHNYTRVDIRRMHAMGVLDEQDVYRAHLDMGYPEDKALALTEFVVQLNNASQNDPDEDLEQLTRTNILNFYDDGLLARERAAQLLQGLGLTPEASELYLDAVDLEDARDERKARVDIIIGNAQAGTITFEEAADQMSSIGLEGAEIQKALLRLEKARVSKASLPTRAEGERMFKAGIISRDAYAGLLERLGYALPWVQAYLALAVKKERG